MIKHLDEDKALQILQTTPKVMVMFVANWCGSCRLFKPRFEKISNKPELSSVVFLCMHSEDAPKIRKLAGVNALPYFASFLNGSLLEARATLREEGVFSMAKNLAETI
ncbi:MAG: thioredoxin family protein [Bacteroidia bacterium]|jgi:thiol-disulfide isomerase/thioredoxin